MDANTVPQRPVERSAVRMLGIIVERQPIDHPWEKWRWRAVEVVPDAPPVGQWRRLRAEGETVRYHAATLPLEIHRTETDAYKYNLSRSPSVYVIMRESENRDFPWQPALVTVSPWDAQAHDETAEDRIDAVPMPGLLIAWLKEFVDRHHVDRPFYKRKRKGRDRKPYEASDFVRVGEERR